MSSKKEAFLIGRQKSEALSVFVFKRVSGIAVYLLGPLRLISMPRSARHGKRGGKARSAGHSRDLMAKLRNAAAAFSRRNPKGRDGISSSPSSSPTGGHLPAAAPSTPGAERNPVAVAGVK